MIALQQIAVTGSLLMSLEQFLESAGPDDIWVLSEVLYQGFCNDEDTRRFEATLMEVASIQGRYLTKPDA